VEAFRKLFFTKFVNHLRPRLHGTGRIWNRAEIRPFRPCKHTRINLVPRAHENHETGRIWDPLTRLIFSPCSVSFVLIGEYIQYSPLINFRLIIPSNIHLQCLCSTKNEKKQHHEGNMALRIISILTH
jgi:hypothetical protein